MLLIFVFMLLWELKKQKRRFNVFMEKANSHGFSVKN